MKAHAKDVYDGCVTALAVISGSILVSMCTVIVFDVALRNLGMQPPRATVALTEYALLYFTMFAAPYLVRKRGHVVVRLIYERLPITPRYFVEIGVYGLCAAVAFVITYVSGGLVMESIGLADTEPRSIDLPRWLLFTPLLIGFFFVGCEFLRLLLTGESFYGPPEEGAHTEERY